MGREPPTSLPKVRPTGHSHVQLKATGREAAQPLIGFPFIVGLAFFFNCFFFFLICPLRQIAAAYNPHSEKHRALQS